MIKIITISIIIVLVLIYLNKIITKRNINQIDREKISMYECGFVPFETTNKKYLIKYYIIGLIFLIFDLEAMLLYPTTTILDVSLLHHSYIIYTIIILFLIILILGLIFEFKAGVFETSSENND